MKILLIGANGLIGTNLIYILSRANYINLYALVRKKNKYNYFFETLSFKNLIELNNYFDLPKLQTLIKELKPKIIINCCGITKHNPNIQNKEEVIYINALFPHVLARISNKHNAKLIHISTDCVFSGSKGLYDENSDKDANDFYGKTKSLGELNDVNNLTLRTSTIGHEAFTSFGLLNWFLDQKKCVGYTKAIFSGPTTLELAKIIKNQVLPNPSLTGLLNIAAKPIDKFTLLGIIKKVYSLNTIIEPCSEVKVNRSLNSKKFLISTNYSIKSWDQMILEMFQEKKFFF